MLELLPFANVFSPFVMLFLIRVSSATIRLIRTKLDTNVLRGVLHRILMGIFVPPKKIANVTKKGTEGSDRRFWHISPKLFGFEKFSHVEHGEIYLW